MKPTFSVALETSGACGCPVPEFAVQRQQRNCPRPPKPSQHAILKQMSSTDAAFAFSTDSTRRVYNCNENTKNLARICLITH